MLLLVLVGDRGGVEHGLQGGGREGKGAVAGDCRLVSAAAAARGLRTARTAFQCQRSSVQGFVFLELKTKTSAPSSSSSPAAATRLT